PHYKFGIAQLYAATETPVLPVAVNSGLFWPRRSFLIRPGTVVIEFLPLIAPGMKPRAFFDTLSMEIEAASDRLIAEALAKDPSLAEIVEKGRTSAQSMAPAHE
ncbi:MAG: 1-acyl-sn-glycerol-3-phosphate acyltransferase, partial [Methylocystis sp.]